MTQQPASHPRYSVIVPVYNRPDEVSELLDSLLSADRRDSFEVIIVEDGSTIPCVAAVDNARRNGLDITYILQANEGRSPARNRGIAAARGEWLIFFDSDCVIPPGYFSMLDAEIERNAYDCYGGPDAAHQSFSDTQKAINYSMTSFLTTGGIRGGKGPVRLEKFVPRTFNMGFRREVADKVGGFREMYSEDIDMSMRIRRAGFSIGLYPDLKVWHKRRVDMRKFARQVYVFGMSRVTLKLLYPGSLKAVHLLPAVFVVGVLALIILVLTVSWWFALPVVVYFAAIFIGALISTHSLHIALLAVPAAAIQLGGYGVGFIKAYFTKIILGRGRDINEEIAMRRGK